MRGPFMIWCLILGLYFAVELSTLPKAAVVLVNTILFVLGTISVTVVLADMASKVIRVYASKIESALPVTSLTQNIFRMVIYGIGVLVILNGLGISIVPILATLGVGGLAVALALQGTLANLFAGFHIAMAKQIRVGDYIKLESGEEGYVEDINWRTTKIKTLPSNMILVPNEKLNKATVTNYSLPDKECAVLVQISVHYDSDLKHVEKITGEVARAVLRDTPGGVPHFEPTIRYHALGDFCILFTVTLRAKEFSDQHLIKHEFIKRLHARYKQEGILIPAPIRAIHFQPEKAE